jgi:hypothetical protein
MSDIVNVTEQLEALIDRHGLQHILTGLEIVCGEKAEHICHDWQDASTAKAWDAAARKIGRLARETDI